MSRPPVSEISEKRSDKGGTRDRRQKFVDIAEKRTANALKAIRIIGKLANRSAYEFEEQDVKKIVSALSREVDDLKHRFSRKGGKEGIEFKL